MGTGDLNRKTIERLNITARVDLLRILLPPKAKIKAFRSKSSSTILFEPGMYLSKEELFDDFTEHHPEGKLELIDGCLIVGPSR